MLSDLGIPSVQKEFSEIYLLALCNFREASNQTYDAKLGQACSVRNRVLRPGWWGKGYTGVILCPFQYSSFNHNDPNSGRFPVDGDAAWPDCVRIAQAVHSGGVEDNTHGAAYYFDRSLDTHPPEWAAKYEHTCDIGDFHFYRSA